MRRLLAFLALALSLLSPVSLPVAAQLRETAQPYQRPKPYTSRARARGTTAMDAGT